MHFPFSVILEYKGVKVGSFVIETLLFVSVCLGHFVGLVEPIHFTF